jgi:HD domain
MHPQIIQPIAVVAFFWWVVFTCVALFFAPTTFVASLDASWRVLLLALSGLVAGGAGVTFWIVLDRQTTREMLQPRTERGLTASIGEVPLNAQPPIYAPKLPSFTGLSNVPPDFFPKWLTHFEVASPAHAKLANALLRIYEQNKHLPATHVKGGHGGRTLLHHTLLVCVQAHELAKSWDYDGLPVLHDRKGKKVILPLRDASYVFDKRDPLIVLIALAHDLGKIDSYIFRGKEIVGTRHEHDLAGARLLARMPELWDIPDDDRQALLLAIAHYHHPVELPLAEDRRAIDDRTIALMELLIKADRAAGHIEMSGIQLNSKQIDLDLEKQQIADAPDDVVWDAFINILAEAGRINSSNEKFNVGTIARINGLNEHKLVLHESAIRTAIMKTIGLHSADKLGDGRYELTVRLLSMIDAKGALIKKVRDIEYDAKSALWRINWFGKTAKSGSEAARLTFWGAAIIVDTKLLPYLKTLNVYHWTGEVDRGTMGAARSVKAPPPGQTVAATQAPSAAPPVAVPPAAPEAAPVVAAQPEPVPSQAEPLLVDRTIESMVIRVEDQVPVPAPAPAKKESISPDVLRNHAHAICRAGLAAKVEREGVELYVFSRMALISNFPDVNWQALHRDIINLSKEARMSDIAVIESSGDLWFTVKVADVQRSDQ